MSSTDTELSKRAHFVWQERVVARTRRQLMEAWSKHCMSGAPARKHAATNVTAIGGAR